MPGTDSFQVQRWQIHFFFTLFYYQY